MHLDNSMSANQFPSGPHFHIIPNHWSPSGTVSGRPGDVITAEISKVDISSPYKDQNNENSQRDFHH